MTTTANPGHQLPPHRQRPKRSRTPLVIGGVVVALLVAGVLAFGVFEVHTLLTDEEVAEAGPTFDSGVQAAELPADIDPAAVETVQVWCKRFDATFTEAALA